MDRQVWNTRQKATANILNNMIGDSETGINTTVKEALFDQDTVQTGLTGSASGAAAVTMAAGRAYEATNGKRIDVPTADLLEWNSSDGQVAGTSTNRLDLISISHTYLDGSTQPRDFIDTDVSSSTYGQAYTSNVVVDKDDYYEVTITSGTNESASPPVSVPFCPSGTIPLFTVQIASGTSTHITTAQIDNNIFDRYRSEWVTSLRDTTRTMVHDTKWQLINWATSGSTLTTAEKHLHPSLVVSIRGGNNANADLYYSQGFFDAGDGYVAIYDPSNGNVAVVNNTSNTERYARVMLFNTLD